jgi:hypothetical protein
VPTPNITIHQLEGVLTPSAQDTVLGLLKTDPSNPPKVAYQWESHLPEPLDSAQHTALDMANPTPISDDMRGLVRQWPLQRMHQSQVDQLEWVSAWMDHVSTWEQTDPKGCDRAKTETAKHLKSYCKALTPDTPPYELAYNARLAAHCQLAAHVTGFVATKDDTSIKLNSAGLRALQSSIPQRGYEADFLSNLKQIPTGIPVTVKFNTRPIPDGMGTPQELYAQMFDEFAVQSPIYKAKNPDVKWTTNHSIQQLGDTQAPDLAITTSRIIQKGVPIDLHFNLLGLAAHDQNSDNIPLLSPAELDASGLKPQDWKALKLSPTKQEAAQPWFEAVQAYPGVQHLLAGDYDKALAPNFQFQKELGPTYQKLIKNEFILAYREINPKGYANLAVSAFRKADPAKFGQLAVQDLPKVKSMGISDEALGKARDWVALNCTEQLRALPGAAKRVQDRFLRDRKVTLMHLEVSSEYRDMFPLQKHPIYGETPFTFTEPKGGKLATYVPREMPLLEAANQPGYFLSEAHHKGLCIEGGKGVIPESVIAMQGIFTTFNSDTVCAAYSHLNEQNMRRSSSFATKICSIQEDVGTMLFAYPFRSGASKPLDLANEKAEVDLGDEYSEKGDPMVRIRTNTKNSADLAKYYTPSFKALRKVDPDTPVREIPMYVYAPMVSAKARNFLADRLVTQAMQDQGKQGEEWKNFGKKVLRQAGFARYKGALDNPALPVFAIEGEKKSLSVNQMQDFGYLRQLREAFSLDKPNAAYLQEIKEQPMVVPVGTIGVWLTHAPAGTKEHELRPEIAETLNLKDRKFIIGHDNDGADKIEVAASAATAAKVLHRDYGVDPIYWRPPEGPGKGFDDWVEEIAKDTDAPTWAEKVEAGYKHASREFEGLMAPLRTDMVYGDIQEAQKTQDIKNLQDFITGQEQSQQMDLV